jgi:SAM-dependent methyltransferase
VPGKKAKPSLDVATLLRGFAAAQVMLTADALGVFNALAAGPRSLAQLSATLELPSASLDRLLVAACAVGLVRRKKDVFRLTPEAKRQLVSGRPGYEGGMFSLYRDELYPLFHHLRAAVRENKPQWEKLGDQASTYQSLYSNPERLRDFMASMFSKSYPLGLRAVKVFGLKSARHLVDLGGATGGFTVALCTRLPRLQATIFDLPEVMPLALEEVASRKLKERVQVVAGDFFKGPLPEGDLFVLASILHNWTEEEGTMLLERVFQALSPGGSLLISEMLLDDTQDGPFIAAVNNLEMLVATRGRERSAAEYDAWLKSVGFSKTRSLRGPDARGFVLASKA